MRKIISLFAILFIITAGYAQSIDQKNVPAVVLNAFQVKFPNANNTSWKLRNGNYHIKFKVNNKSNDLILDHKGNTIRHSQDLYYSEVPKAVLKTVAERVPFYDIHDVDKITEGGKITYELYFKIDGKQHSFWIDEKGKLIKFRRELRENQVPSNIIAVITSEYSSFEYDRAKYLEEGNLKYYMIRGEINDYDCLFVISENARILRYNQDIRKEELPEGVRNTLKNSYRGYEVRDIYRMEEYGKLKYLAKLRRSKEQIRVTFNNSGEVLSVRED